MLAAVLLDMLLSLLEMLLLRLLGLGWLGLLLTVIYFLGLELLLCFLRLLVRLWTEVLIVGALEWAKVRWRWSLKDGCLVTRSG